MGLVVFRLLAIVAIGASMAPANAAEPLAYPQWSAAQVRAARAVAPEDALLFDLRLEENDDKAGAKVTLSSVTLTASFTDVATGPSHLLDDHTLCRSLAWSDGTPSFENSSCYAGPMFRLAESANRQRLAQLVGKAARNSPFPAESYWTEAELAIQNQPSDPLVARPVADGTEYRLRDEPVVRTSRAAVQLTAAEAQWMQRYFANHLPLHPQIRRALKASATLPARIEIETRATGGTQHWIVTFANVRRAKARYPLPPGLTAALRARAGKGDTPEARGLQQAILAADGHSAIRKPIADALLADMQSAASAKNGVLVTLLFLEFSQQYGAAMNGPDGPALLSRLRPLVQFARSDAAASPLWNANALAGDDKAPGDREAAARYLASASDLDRMPFGTFRYVTFANLAGLSKDAARWDKAIFNAMPTPLAQGYWVHIAAYPWAGNAYKDAGDAALSGYDMQGAWIAYDLGRAVDKDWHGAGLGRIGALEDGLKAHQPDFF